jgi:hypothetical protein
LTQLSQCGEAHGLKFNPKKTEAVLFNRGYKKLKGNHKLIMDGQTIEHKTEVKYLGVTLDNKLSWKPHITHKLATAKGQLVRLLSEMRGTFGTKPKLVKWAYTGVVRPKLTYVCMTWSNGLIFDYQMKELKKLDRLACREAVTLNRTTPQAALNLMLDITPIHLHIQELAIAAFARLEPVLGHPWRPVQDSSMATQNTFGIQMPTVAPDGQL